MSVLCLGPKSAGKTHLLSSLQHSGSINRTSHSVPTIGTNLFSIALPNRLHAKPAKKAPTAKRSTPSGSAVGPSVARTVFVREVGGTMAPMWSNYLGNVAKILYVVDTSNLCQISAAGE